MQSEEHTTRRGRPPREVSTNDMPMNQPADVFIAADNEIDRGAGLVMMTDDQISEEEYMAELAFNEEPVTIRIEVQSRSDSPMTHIPCWVNGKAAEVLIDGKWISAGWLPIETELTIKRKYVEVLARAKPEDVTTHHEDRPQAGVPVMVRKRATSAYPMTILNDTPAGIAWMQRIKMSH